MIYVKWDLFSPFSVTHSTSIKAVLNQPLMAEFQPASNWEAWVLAAAQHLVFVLSWTASDKQRAPSGKKNGGWAVPASGNDKKEEDDAGLEL